MSKRITGSARAVLRRERRRPTLSWKANAIVGAALGAAVPLVLIIKDHSEHVGTEFEHKFDLRGEGGMVAFFAALGAVSSQKGWRGLLISSVCTATLSAAITDDPDYRFTFDTRRDMAQFGAFAGPIVGWPIVRFIIRAI